MTIPSGLSEQEVKEMVNILTNSIHCLNACIQRDGLPYEETLKQEEDLLRELKTKYPECFL